MQISTTPAEARVHIDRAVRMGGRLTERLGFDPEDAFGSLKVSISGGRGSYYDSIRGRAIIALAHPDHQGPDAARALVETTLHEGVHHMIRHQTGWPGLVAGARPGMVGEGLGQVLAGAAMVLEGETDADREWGWRKLDPRGDTTPVGKRDVPLSLTMRDIRSPFQYPGDMGGVHVHAGIIQNAHYHLARSVGMLTMAQVTADAMRTGLGRFTGIEGWARATLRSAERLHGDGAGVVDAVRAAWQAVDLTLAAV